MGQLAKDWTQLKTIIRQKDDALDRQAAQIAELQKELAAHQASALDSDDQTAVAELRQTVNANAPSAPTANIATTNAAPTPAIAHPPVTTFTK